MSQRMKQVFAGWALEAVLAAARRPPGNEDSLTDRSSLGGLRRSFFTPGVAFRPMRPALLTVLSLALIRSATASAQPAVTGAPATLLSARNASYTIAARLDPATRTITGSEVITWRNI